MQILQVVCMQASSLWSFWTKELISGVAKNEINTTIELYQLVLLYSYLVPQSGYHFSLCYYWKGGQITDQLGMQQDYM